MYLSADSLAEVDQQSVYPTEYLNSLTLSGLPPHKLSIKLGAVIMLLRNMDPSRGHCNGTRYIVRQVSRRCITAEISCGEYSMHPTLTNRRRSRLSHSREPQPRVSFKLMIEVIQKY